MDRSKVTEGQVHYMESAQKGLENNYNSNHIPGHGRPWQAGNNSRLSQLHSQCYGRHVAPDAVLSDSPEKPEELSCFLGEQDAHKKPKKMVWQGHEWILYMTLGGCQQSGKSLTHKECKQMPMLNLLWRFISGKVTMQVKVTFLYYNVEHLLQCLKCSACMN